MSTPRIITTPQTLERIDTLEPHPDNPRRGATPAIIESIRTTGFYGALLAQASTRRVIAGNHRLAAAKAAGLSEVPVMWLDVDDATAKRIMLADNRTADLAGYDLPGLHALLDEVAATDTALTGTGYRDEDLEDLLRELHPYTPATPDPPARTSSGGGAVTAEAVTRAQERLEETASKERDLHPAMCPECGHEFYVD